jgi:hypothetical protein
VDANHFRNRAARAREMAKSGDDPRLVEMLLDVARDLDAEAEAIDAESITEGSDGAAVSCGELFGSLLWPTEHGNNAGSVQVINLSLDGAKLRTETVCEEGRTVVLDLPEQGLRLSGCIIRAAGLEASMIFAPASVQNPALGRYLRRRCPSKAAEIVGAN